MVEFRSKARSETNQQRLSGEARGATLTTNVAVRSREKQPTMAGPNPMAVIRREARNGRQAQIESRREAEGQRRCNSSEGCPRFRVGRQRKKESQLGLWLTKRDRDNRLFKRQGGRG